MNFKGPSSVNRRRFGSRLTTTGLMVNATELNRVAGRAGADQD
jgi:hypothetical protein